MNNIEDNDLNLGGESAEFELDFGDMGDLGTRDYDKLVNRPKYNGQTITSETDIPEVIHYKAGENINIDNDGTISSTAGKVILYGQLGLNTDGAMTQKAIADSFYNNGVELMGGVQIGKNAYADAENGVSIGTNANAIDSAYSVVIGNGAVVDNNDGGVSIGQNSYSANGSIAIGQNANAEANNSIAFGVGAEATREGELNIGAEEATGFNSSNYRVIGGVYDGQNNHDAATVGQVKNAISNALDGLTIVVLTQTEYDNLSTYDSNTLYIIKADS